MNLGEVAPIQHGSSGASSAYSEALAVNNGGARLVVLSLGDPHLLESGQRGQDGTANPHRVLALRWRDHLDPHGRGRECGELLGHALTDAGEHGGTTRQDNVAH